MANTKLHDEDLQVFPFMKLPREIRMMVYDNLHREIRHYTIYEYKFSKDHDSVTTEVVEIDRRYAGTTLVIRSVDTSILRTCREVYAEANNVVQRVLTNFITNSAPRIIDGLFLLGRPFAARFLVDILNAELHQIPRLVNLMKRELFSGWIDGRPVVRKIDIWITQALRQVQHRKVVTYFSRLHSSDLPVVELVQCAHPDILLNLPGHLLGFTQCEPRVTLAVAGIFRGKRGIRSDAVPGILDRDADYLLSRVPVLERMTLDTWVSGWLE